MKKSNVGSFILLSYAPEILPDIRGLTTISVPVGRLSAATHTVTIDGLMVFRAGVPVEFDFHSGEVVCKRSFSDGHTPSSRRLGGKRKFGPSLS